MTELQASRSGKSAFEVATMAAMAAGEIIKAGLSEEKQVTYKGKANAVTDVDLEVDGAIKSLLHDEYPDHGILTEESAAIKSASGYTWVIDPLDGTNNYAFSIPFCSTVIALAKGEDVLLGLIYDPLRDEMFSAQKGKGALLNGSPIHVSRKTSVQDALLGFDLGYVEEKGRRTLEFLTALWRRMHSIRIMGSGALGLAYAACGRVDLYFHPLLYPWELTCGRLLLTEAGGTITDWEGKQLRIAESSVIASNSTLHAEFLSLIKTK
ncbi:inositol monophosphatase family protein [Chloroflexota bacterium]